MCCVCLCYCLHGSLQLSGFVLALFVCAYGALARYVFFCVCYIYTYSHMVIRCSLLYVFRSACLQFDNDIVVHLLLELYVSAWYVHAVGWL